METPLVLTFDVGTQSARCALTKPNGEFEDLYKIKYEQPYLSPYPGWAEQEPNFYYDRICDAARVICERNRDKLKDVIGVTVTTIRDTVLCLDSENRPLRNIILWVDKRQAEFDDPFSPIHKFLFRLVGMKETTEIIYRASACNWLKQNEKDIWSKMSSFVVLSTYINYKLTGNLVDSEANMIGHIPFDYKRRKWCSRFELTRCIRDVPSEKLCRLVKSGETIGRITKEFSQASGVPEGLPLIATGSDKGCETLGLSVCHENQASISLGTTATLQFSMKKYIEPQPYLPAYPAVINGLYNPEIEIYRGLWLVSWFIREFAHGESEEAEKLGISTEELLDSRIATIRPGSEGLLLQPYWTPGIVNPTSKGAIIGFSDSHTKYHLYRSIIEGLAFELFTSLSIMERRAHKSIDEAFIGGGGAGSDIICQILADVMGIPIKRIQTPEASTLGSSMVAFVALKVFGSFDEAISSMVHESDVFMPDPHNHQIYMDYYRSAYSKMFGRLEPLYRKIIKISKQQGDHCYEQ